MRRQGRFLERKSRKINQGAFIYLVKGIYEGYGVIEKEGNIMNENDILGHLIPQPNNYDTTRIVIKLDKKVLPLTTFLLSE